MQQKFMVKNIGTFYIKIRSHLALGCLIPPNGRSVGSCLYLKCCRFVHYGLFCINFEFSKYYIKVLFILTPKFLVCTPFKFCTQHEYPSCLPLAQPG